MARYMDCDKERLSINMETTFAFGFLVFILSYAGNLVLIVEVDVVHFFFAVEKSLIEIDVSNEYYIEMHTATP